MALRLTKPKCRGLRRLHTKQRGFIDIPFFDGVGARVIFQNDLQTTLVPQKSAGSNVATFTRATTAYVRDWEGLYKQVLSGEARFTGARRVQNLVISRTDGDFSSWNGVGAPSGSTSGSTIAFSGAGNDWRYIANAQVFPLVSGHTYVLTFTLQRGTKTGTIVIRDTGGLITDTVATLPSSATRFSYTKTASSSANVQLGFDNRVSVGGDGIAGTIFCTSFQIEDVTGQSNQNPSEYVSVGVLPAPYHGAGVDAVKYFDYLNGNTVASNVVTEATGAPISDANGSASTVDAGGPFGYPAEGTRTNLILQSQAFATSWLNPSTNVNITSNSVAAPDGTTTAETLAEKAVTGFFYIYQAVTSTADVNHTISVFFKDNTRRYSVLQLNDGVAGRAYVVADLQTGTITDAAALAGGTYTGSTITSAEDGWYRVTLTGKIAAGRTDGHLLLGLSNSATGQISSYAGDISKSIYAWGAMFEDNISFASSYIPTTTVAVARNASVAQYVSAGNLPTNNFTVYGESEFPLVPAAGNYYLFGTYVDANNGTAVLWDGTNLIARRRIGGVSSDATIALTPTAATVFKWAARFSGTSGTDIFLNGTKGTNEAVTTACQIGTNFQIGADGNGANQPFATARAKVIYSRALSDSRLMGMTA